MRRAVAKNNECLMLVDRTELYNQTVSTLARCGMESELIKIGMILTVANRLQDYNPKIIIADECNKSLSKTYRKFFNAYPNAYIIGLSATPYRLSGEPMGAVYDDIIEPITTKELIAIGLIANYKYYSINLDTVNFTGLKKRAGDYVAEDLFSLMGSKYVYGHVIRDFTNLAHDKKTIVFCATIKHSEETAEEFRKAGYTAEHIDANTPKLKRQKIIDRFRSGETQILTNVSIVSYGFDAPNCDCVVLLKKTESLPLFIQSVMRSMRPYGDKIALIIDFVGNCYSHGLPDDDREWSLKGKQKNAESEVKIKSCPDCFAVLYRDVLICPHCGFDFSSEVKGRKEKERLEAELKEITENEISRIKNMDYKEHENFTTWEEIEAFRSARNYKIFWAIRTAKRKLITIPNKYKKLEKMVKL